MPELAKLDRKRPYGEIYDSVPNVAKYEQDGKLFNSNGVELASSAQQQPEPEPPAAPTLPPDPWQKWKIPHLRVEYERVMGQPADREFKREYLIEAIEKAYEEQA